MNDYNHLNNKSIFVITNKIGTRELLLITKEVV